jgi:hypothetical protein
VVGVGAAGAGLLVGVDGVLGVGVGVELAAKQLGAGLGVTEFPQLHDCIPRPENDPQLQSHVNWEAAELLGPVQL